MYIRLADQIAEDIICGELPVGAKLPPQRDLAYDLGVTVGTIGRAYSMVRERGLVSGEVGRGTYVLGTNPEADTTAAYFATNDDFMAPPPRQTQNADNRSWVDAATSSTARDFGSTRAPVPADGAIRLDSTSAPEVGQAEVIRELMTQITIEKPYEIASYTRVIPDSWRLAGRKWLSRSGWEPSEASIVPTTGAQAAIMSIIAATTTPGDRIAFEELSYSSISRGGALSGRPAVHVATDEDGPLPDDLDRLCSQKHPKLLFLMPTLQNPTLRTMSEGRRHEIVEVARRHNLWLIEDEVYGSLRETNLTPLAALAPERTFHVGSLSKSVTAGVRGGWVSSPQSHAQRIYTAHKMLTGGISFLLSELSSRLVLSGAADMFREKSLAEIAKRHAHAMKFLQGYDFVSAPDAPFLWLKLPDPHFPGTFKAAAANANVLIDDEDEFKIGRTEKTYYRVRIGFSNPSTREEATRGLEVLRQLLDSPGSYDSFE